MAIAVAVFLAGGLGALTRSAVNSSVMRRYHTASPTGNFEAGTFFINVTGATMLGLVTGIYGWRVGAGLETFDFATIFGTGYLGAYTTFSTEEWQTLGTARSRPFLAVFNVTAMVVLSLAGAGLGLWTGTQF